MANYPDDLARSIAENIGVMPIVTKAGEMGGGLLDFLSSIIARAQPPAAPAPAMPVPQPKTQPELPQPSQPSQLDDLVSMLFRNDRGGFSEMLAKLLQQQKQ